MVTHPTPAQEASLLAIGGYWIQRRRATKPVDQVAATQVLCVLSGDRAAAAEGRLSALAQDTARAYHEATAPLHEVILNSLWAPVMVHRSQQLPAQLEEEPGMQIDPALEERLYGSSRI